MRDLSRPVYTLVSEALTLRYSMTNLRPGFAKPRIFTAC